jgi:hypothetical protein
MAAVVPFAVTDPGASHVVIELFGGDNSLSSFVDKDIAEMSAGMAAAKGNRFAIIGLVDRRTTGGQVLEITSDGTRHVVEELGEIDTGDPETLAGFIARALVTYPQARKALGFWDHGSGVFDEHDSTEVNLDRFARVSSRGRPRRPARHLFVGHLAAHGDPDRRAAFRAMLEDDSSGGILTNYEAHGVVKAAFARAGQTAKIDLIFSDTCLNGMVEVLDQFRTFASVVVASEELEPGDGWDYTRFLGLMAAKPPTTAVAWGGMAVQAFGDGYAHRPSEYPCTLAAFKSRNGLATAMRSLLTAVGPMGRDGFRLLDDVRSDTQAFAGFNSYDLRDFGVRLAAAGEPALVAPANALVKAVDAASIASVALGDDVADAHGLAFWFPSGKAAYAREAGTYAKLAFPSRTGWATFLRKRYG